MSGMCQGNTVSVQVEEMQAILDTYFVHYNLQEIEARSNYIAF